MGYNSEYVEVLWKIADLEDEMSKGNHTDEQIKKMKSERDALYRHKKLLRAFRDMKK